MIYKLLDILMSTRLSLSHVIYKSRAVLIKSVISQSIFHTIFIGYIGIVFTSRIQLVTQVGNHPGQISRKVIWMKFKLSRDTPWVVVV